MAKKNNKRNEATATETATETTPQDAVTNETPQDGNAEATAEATAELAKRDWTGWLRTNIIQPIADKRTSKEGVQDVYNIVKDLEAAARDYSGEKMKQDRIAIFASVLGVDKEQIAESKAGTTALSQVFTNILQGIDPAEGVRETVMKKEKDITPSELELALASGSFGLSATASERLKALDADDINRVQSAAHAGFQTAIRLLSTKEHAFPRQCVDFLSFMIAASNGSSDWFECTDGFISEAARVSTKTIQRGRDALVKWQEASGKGILSIRQENKKPTMYKLNLLGSVTTIIQNMLGSDNANTENMLVVAGLSGKLLTESTDKLRAEVSDSDLAAARQLNSELSAAVDTLPKPDVTLADATIARTKDAKKAKFESLRADIGTALEQASEHDLPEVSERLEKLAVTVRDANNAYDENGTEPDFEGFENQLTAQRVKINDKIRSAVTEAEAQKEKEKKEQGEVSEETRRNIATANVDLLTTEEEQIESQEAWLEEWTTDTYLLAELASKQGDEAKQKAFLQMQEILKNAFGY